MITPELRNSLLELTNSGYFDTLIEYYITRRVALLDQLAIQDDNIQVSIIRGQLHELSLQIEHLARCRQGVASSDLEEQKIMHKDIASIVRYYFERSRLSLMQLYRDKISKS